MLAIAVASVLIVAASSGSGSTTTAPAPTPVKQIGPIAMSAEQLKMFVSRTFKQPVYWAGPMSGDSYELTRKPDGSVYVRYLPRGVAAGDPRSDFLLIATYPYADALDRLEASANGRGTTLASGVFVLPDASYPRSVHMAFPGAAFEIEVYDPSPSTSRRIAGSGDIGPVG